eukprot:COSAG02_NODE_1545_length_11996_cov_6.889636_10_plen_133_part_00
MQLQLFLACCTGMINTDTGSSTRGVYDFPSIAFDTANWTFDRGVAVTRNAPNGTQVCITGNPNAYVKATLKLPAAELPGGSVDVDSPCGTALQGICRPTPRVSLWLRWLRTVNEVHKRHLRTHVQCDRRQCC